MRPILIAVLIAVAGAANLRAQRYNFKVYGEEEGLKNLVVQTILQDRAGFFWVGTQNGLYRYDGSRFVAFSKSEGLPNARVEALHESVDGSLWVGTRFGLARRKGDRFEPIAMNVAQGVVSRSGIASDATGKLYLATERGLVTGTPTGGAMQFALIPSPQREYEKPEEATSVYVDPKGSVWYGCGTGLCRLERGKARDVGPESGLPAESWSAIIGDLEGNLWIRSDRLLYVRQESSQRFLPRTGLPESTNTFATLALDPSGRLLVPNNSGLARETGTGWETIDARQGLPTNDIAAIMQDREGSIWLGLLGSGLARWLGYNEWQSWSDREGLSRESVWSIAHDGSGRLWVGTQFGLNYAEERNGRMTWRQQPVPGVEMIRALAYSNSNPRDPGVVNRCHGGSSVPRVMVPGAGSMWIGATPGASAIGSRHDATAHHRTRARADQHQRAQHHGGSRRTRVGLDAGGIVPQESGLAAIRGGHASVAHRRGSVRDVPHHDDGCERPNMGRGQPRPRASVGRALDTIHGTRRFEIERGRASRGRSRRLHLDRILRCVRAHPAHVSARPTQAGTLHHRQRPAIRQVDVPGLRRARLAVGGIRSRRRRVRSHALAALREIRRADLGRLQQQRVLRRSERRRLGGHQPRPVAIPPAGVARAERSAPVVFTSVKFGDQSERMPAARRAISSNVHPYRAVSTAFAASALRGADVHPGIGRVVSLSVGERRSRLAGNRAARTQLSATSAGRLHAGSDGAQRARRVERGAGSAAIPDSLAVVAHLVVPGRRGSRSY